MKKENYELLENGSIQEITEFLAAELKKRNESPFWAEKVVPFSGAILSVLKPLQEANLLFDPQGNKQDKLTLELFLEWSDFVSLKTLAFTIQKSNNAKELQNTKLAHDVCQTYKEIDLSLLGDYLAKHNVNLENEQLDFPISAYNLHQGVSNVISSLMK